MANHASALKRAKQSIKRRDRNRSYRTRVRNAIKSVMVAVEENDADGAKTALSSATKLIDKAAGRGIYHQRNAARKVSRLSRKVHALSA